jgi:hypothetical protein
MVDILALTATLTADASRLGRRTTPAYDVRWGPPWIRCEIRWLLADVNIAQCNVQCPQRLRYVEAGGGGQECKREVEVEAAVLHTLLVICDQLKQLIQK